MIWEMINLADQNKTLGSVIGEALNKKSFEAILQTVIESAKELLHLSMNIEELQGVIERKVHGVVIDKENELKSTFLGGELIFDYVDADNFTCTVNIFFQDDQKKIKKSAVKSPNLPMSSLDEKSREQLEKTKSLKFEIDEPTKEFREVYRAGK